MNTKVAVIAGTPVDTKMGAEFLALKEPSLEIIEYPVSLNPQEQTCFQFSGKSEKHNKIKELITDAIGRDCRHFFVYCNSLAGAVDFSEFNDLFSIKIVTPLQVYGEIAVKYNLLGVIAANNQSLAGIEKTAVNANPDCEVLGMSLLPVVKAIEQKMSADEILRHWQIPAVVAAMETAGIEAFILGCTHFPYFENELKPYVHVPLINPAELMFENLF